MVSLRVRLLDLPVRTDRVRRGRLRVVDARSLSFGRTLAMLTHVSGLWHVEGPGRLLTEDEVVEFVREALKSTPQSAPRDPA